MSPVYRWDKPALNLRRISGGTAAAPTYSGSGTFFYDVTDPSSNPSASYDYSAWNWSADMRPWDVADLSVLQTKLPSGVPVVSLQVNSAKTPYQNLMATCDAASTPVIVRAPNGTRFISPAFTPVGASGDPTYAFGFYHPRLRGVICDAGVNGGVTFEMAPSCMTDAQLNALKMKAAGSSGNPNQMALMRVDSSQAYPAAFIGVTFRSPDQNLLTDVDSSLDQYNVYTPQPAPFAGVVFYAEKAKPSYAGVYYCLAEAAGHAMSSLPPFEHANFSSQYGSSVVYDHVESDGRISAVFNSARPRRCAVMMANNELAHRVVDSWLHHANVSRYAANDQNAETSGVYDIIRTKIDHISDLHNADPAQNNGQSLGGVSNASTMGWESCNGTINLVDVISEQDNNATSPDIAHHVSLTPVGSRGNPRGGRLNITRGVFTNPGFPSVNGFICLRIIDSTYWNTDGYDTTLTVLGQDGTTRLKPYKVTGWAPTAASLASAGVSSQTHYLVRGQ